MASAMERRMISQKASRSFGPGTEWPKILTIVSRLCSCRKVFSALVRYFILEPIRWFGFTVSRPSSGPWLANQLLLSWLNVFLTEGSRRQSTPKAVDTEGSRHRRQAKAVEGCRHRRQSKAVDTEGSRIEDDVFVGVNKYFLDGRLTVPEGADGRRRWRSSRTSTGLQDLAKPGGDRRRLQQC